MSTKKKLLEAAAGNAVGGSVYLDDVFSTYVYEGTGSSNFPIVNDIDIAGKGGLVWIKHRTNQSFDEHALTDTERGAGYELQTNSTAAQTYNNTRLKSFNNNGFTLGGSARYNENGDPFVSWTFAKQKGFFDVVTYTGTGSVRTVSHNLDAEVGFMVVKRLNSSEGWQVYHRETGATKHYEWPGNGGPSTSATRWNNTAPTSSVFTVNTHASVNGNGDTYVAYLFAHNATGFGASGNEKAVYCGEYSGNGSSSGPTIATGFEPQWVMIKRKTSSGEWVIGDNIRGMIDSSATSEPYLSVCNQDPETNTNWIKLTSTGFTIQNSGENFNASSFDYIYVAIARPNKPADATDLPASKLFDINVGATGSRVAFELDMTPDMAFERQPGGGDNPLLFQRLTGPWYVQTSSSGGDADSSSINWDYMNGVIDYGSWAGSYLCWAWKRAPGYFDAATYTGTGSPITRTHNLGVAPEMMWIKVRNSSVSDGSWFVYHKETGASKKLILNAADGQANTSVFNSYTPTESYFQVNDTGTNETGKLYVAYFFASTPGVSKVGSYTGTGNNLNIDCGFTNGARFVLIKRVDAGASGNWIYWDFYRGINAGTDPWLRLDNTASAVTSTDYIDPLSSGFSIVTDFNQINASGGEYIFYAIA